ncbi:MAG: L,D-transpeptidase [Myxococcales bacterium]|nr:L,D-transpeptidase [Myxococcales bacterium]MCB9713671.1 L,D-transpeptidase [Myxococcales bacterium]
MDRNRLIEMIGSFLLGGGVVAMAYELGRGPGSEGTEVAAEEDPAGPEGEARAHGEGGGGAPEEGGASPYAEGEAEGGAEGEAAEEGGGEELALAELPDFMRPDDEGSYAAFPPIYDQAPAPFDEAAEAIYTHHGLVTSLAVVVRERADLESPIIGVLHAGTRVRLDGERTFGGGCEPGWNRVFPRGWICRLAGLRHDATPPSSALVTASVKPDVSLALPYEYWRVKDEMTPFFHRLPTFNEQDQADAAGQAWYATHGRDPMPTDPSARPSDVPAVVKEYMNAGYYVTKGGEEVRMERRFLRTLRGAYARKYQLRIKESPEFRGKVLPRGAKDLPIYFVRRELPLMKRESEGSDVLIDTGEKPARLGTHPFVEQVYIGNKIYYVDDQGLLMRGYGVGKAEKIKRPPGIKADEHWLHVDLGEQTLVAYEGDRPVFATLVSTGKEPGMTPVGVHRVQTKLVASSMRDQPQEDEAYSIDDVPWTQYFSGSVALHGAFWHAGFGQVRSHGCVNLSPSDARWLFGFTDPPLPPDWHAAAPTDGTPRGSAVVVTE